MSRARKFLEQIQEPSEAEIKAWADSIKQQFGLEDFYVYLSRGDLRLASIVVPRGSRKQGAGSKAMEAFCSFADKYNLRCILTTGSKGDSTGTTSTTRLKRFYSQFGFRPNKGRYKNYAISDNMIRPARGNS